MRWREGTRVYRRGLVGPAAVDPLGRLIVGVAPGGYGVAQGGLVALGDDLLPVAARGEGPVSALAVTGAGLIAAQGDDKLALDAELRSVRKLSAARQLDVELHESWACDGERLWGRRNAPLYDTAVVDTTGNKVVASYELDGRWFEAPVGFSVAPAGAVFMESFGHAAFLRLDGGELDVRGVRSRGSLLGFLPDGEHAVSLEEAECRVWRLKDAKVVRQFPFSGQSVLSYRGLFDRIAAAMQLGVADIHVLLERPLCEGLPHARWACVGQNLEIWTYLSDESLRKWVIC